MSFIRRLNVMGVTVVAGGSGTNQGSFGLVLVMTVVNGLPVQLKT